MWFRGRAKKEVNTTSESKEISVKVQKGLDISKPMSSAKDSFKLGKVGVKKPRFRTAGIVFLILAFLALAWFGGGLFGNLYKIFGGASNSGLLSFIQGLTVGKSINGEREGRINVLVLGRGGPGHPGRNLTDTIMVVSLDLKKNKAALLSIPRDLYVKIPKKGYARINTVYDTGESLGKSSKYKASWLDSKTSKMDGPTYCKEFISDLLDIPIHYYLDIDFKGFEKLIDEVDGVKLTVEKEIYDPYFPGPRLIGYNPFYIKAGTQTLDGENALKYARSRKTTSDFDRALRQQQIILALKEKIIKLNIIKDSRKIYNILNILGDHVKTDLQIWEIQRFFELSKKIDLENAETVVLDNGKDGVLRSRTINGASVLVPRAGDYSEIRKIAQNLFTGDIKSTDSISALLSEKKTVSFEIWNGTSKAGLAASLRDILSSEGFEVVRVGNAPAGRYSESQVVDYSQGKYPAVLIYLEKKIGTAATTQGGSLSSGAKILIILGDSYQSF